MTDLLLLALLVVAVGVAFMLPGWRDRNGGAGITDLLRARFGGALVSARSGARRARSTDDFDEVPADPQVAAPPAALAHLAGPPSSDSTALATAFDAVVVPEPWDRRAALTDLSRQGQTLTEQSLRLLSSANRQGHSVQLMFTLERMAHQTRRVLDSCLILSGESPAAHSQGSVALSAIVRAAALSIPAYERVELALASDPELSADVADGLAHLLAELIDPLLTQPEAVAVVRCQETHDGLEILIGDEPVNGRPPASFGLSPLQLEVAHACLNRPSGLLASPQELAFAMAGEIGRRLGVTLRLGRSWDGGTVATLPLPASFVGPRQPAQLPHPLPVVGAGDAGFGAPGPDAFSSLSTEVGDPAEELDELPYGEEELPGIEAEYEEELDVESREEQSAQRNRPGRRRRRGPRSRSAPAVRVSEPAPPVSNAPAEIGSEQPASAEASPAYTPAPSMDVLPGKPFPQPRRASAPASSVPEQRSAAPEPQVAQVSDRSRQPEPASAGVGGRSPAGSFGAETPTAAFGAISSTMAGPVGRPDALGNTGRLDQAQPAPPLQMPGLHSTSASGPHPSTNWQSPLTEPLATFDPSSRRAPSAAFDPQSGPAQVPEPAPRSASTSADSGPALNYAPPSAPPAGGRGESAGGQQSFATGSSGGLSASAAPLPRRNVPTDHGAGMAPANVSGDQPARAGGAAPFPIGAEPAQPPMPQFDMPLRETPFATRPASPTGDGFASAALSELSALSFGDSSFGDMSSDESAPRESAYADASYGESSARLGQQGSGSPRPSGDTGGDRDPANQPPADPDGHTS